MWQKSILNMVNYRFSGLKNYGNNVKTSIDVQPIFENIGVGGRNKMRLLLACHCQIRLAVLGALARLHLHNDQLFTVFGDDVDFLVDVVPIALQYLVALVGEILDGDVFALLA